MATTAAQVVLQLRAENAQYLAKLRESTVAYNRSIETIRRDAGALAGGLGITFGVHELQEYADTWTSAGNKIRAAATAADVESRSLNDLKRDANSARTDLESYVDLYARMIRSASGVAQSEQEIATATNIVAKAFKAGGASASEQAAGILQLGQALGSGVLQGDELRSLRENAPVLAQAIANEFKTTIAGLKQLGAEGKLTSDRVFKAILAAQAPIEAQFKATNATIADAMTQVNNEFLAYIGNADASAGASRDLVDALQYVADNFKGIADVVVQFAEVLIGALAGRALVGVVVGFGNAVVALGTFLTVLRAGTVVAGTFTAALGPIGILAGAAAAAIYVLYEAQSSSERSTSNFNTAIGENEKALKSATDQTYAQVDALRQLIATQAQAARAAATAANADFEAAAGRAAAFREATGGYSFAPFEYSKDVAAQRAEALGNAAGQLEKQLADAEKLLSSKPSGFGTGLDTPPSGKKGSTRKTADDRFAESLQAVRDRTAALKEEQATLGSTFFEQQKRSVALDLEQEALRQVREEARRKGDQDWQNAQLSPAQVKQIDEVSEAYARQADELRKAQEAQDLQRDVLKGVFSDLRSALADGKLDWQDLGDVALNVLDKIADKIENDLVDAILQANNAGGSGGSIFGALGKLFGLGGGGFSSWDYAMADLGVGLFDKGGYTGSGGKYDPAGVVHKGEYVFDQNSVRAAGGPAALDAMRRGLRGYASGGLVGPASIPRLAMPRSADAAPNITYAPVIDARGADAGAVARLEKVLQQDRASFKGRVVEAVADARRRNVNI